MEIDSHAPCCAKICDLAAQRPVFACMVLCIFPCQKRFQGLCIPIGSEGCGRRVGTPTQKRCSDRWTESRRGFMNGWVWVVLCKDKECG